MQTIAEAISLFLTWPTILLGAVVVIKWGQSAWKSLCTKRSERDSTQWFILGVAVAFLGSIVDNGYWGVAWTAHTIDHPQTLNLFATGVYFNIPFRQMAGAYAAYCHLKAYAAGSVENDLKTKRLVVVSLMLGAAHVILTHWFK